MDSIYWSVFYFGVAIGMGNCCIIHLLVLIIKAICKQIQRQRKLKSKTSCVAVGCDAFDPAFGCVSMRKCPYCKEGDK